MINRILFFTNAYPDFEGSFHGNFIKDICMALNEKGIEIYLLVPRVFKRSANYQEDGLTRVYRFPFFSANKKLIEYEKIPVIRMISYFVSGFLYACLLAKRSGVRLIHAHWVVPSGVLGVFVSKVFSLPLIVHAHGSDIRTFARKNSLVRSLSRLTLKSASTVITASHDLRETIIREYNIDGHKVSVVINGVNKRRFYPEDRYKARRRLGISRDDRVILFVGGLIEVKGLDYLLDAFATLKQGYAGSGLKLFLVGEGERRPSLAQKAQGLNVSDSVIFAGSVPNEQIPLYLNSADIFSLPSLSEGTPYSLIEALSCGIPCVASDVGEVSRIIRDKGNGILTRPGDSGSMYRALKLLMETKTLYSRIKNNASASVAQFTLENQVDRLLEIYSQFGDI